MSYTLRAATPDDADVLVELILQLASYEKLRHEANPDANALRRQLAPDAQPRVEALLAEADSGATIGFALFFRNYSTFLTNFGMYLEDLFVRPAYRGRGVGRALLQRVAQIAMDRGCKRLDWAVLNWNTPAIAFYESLGADALDDWTTMRLTEEAISDVAEA
jgi:diamine N-acetyltransferase